MRTLEILFYRLWHARETVGGVPAKRSATELHFVSTATAISKELVCLFSGEDEMFPEKAVGGLHFSSWSTLFLPSFVLLPEYIYTQWWWEKYNNDQVDLLLLCTAFLWNALKNKMKSPILNLVCFSNCITELNQWIYCSSSTQRHFC